MNNKQYLGDGLYVADDGYQIVLIAGNNAVYLEPEVIESFLRYLEKSMNVKITVEKLTEETV